MKYWKALLLGILTPWILYACHASVDALMKVHKWKGLDASAWASWVQAVGAIAAILGAYHLARTQHLRDRAADAAKERREDQAAQNAQLLSRFTVIRNVVQVASYSLESALTAVTLAEQQVASWEIDPYLMKINQLRAVVDSLIATTTEHLAVTTALEVSEVLALTHSDMSNLGGSAAEQLLERCKRRINGGYALLGRLIAMHNELQHLCRSRGIPLEIADFRQRF